MIERTGKSYETWSFQNGNSPIAEQRRKHVEGFLSWVGWSYEDLFEMALEARRSTDPRDMALFTSRLIAYYKMLRQTTRHWGDRVYSPGSAKNHIKSILSFLAANGIIVEFTRAQRKELSGHVVRVKDNFTKQEIQALLKATTSVRNQAIIMALKDSGMAVSDLADLNVGDLSKALDNGDQFVSIEYTRNKSDVSGSPCFGPEALEALRSWMRWRRDRGFSCDSSSPLFIVTDDVPAKGQRLSGAAITNDIRHIVKRSGVGESKRLSAHSFRIFNQSALESAGGMNKNLVYRQQARIIPDSGRTYSKGEVLSSYKKAYAALAVGPRALEIQDVRVAELEAKNAAIEAQLAEEHRKNEERDAAIREIMKHITKSDKL